MKKISENFTCYLQMRVCVTCLISFIAVATSLCFAQGTFFARNISPLHNLDAPVFDAAGKRLFGSNYVAMLYGGPTSDALTPAIRYFSSQDMDPAPLTVIDLSGRAGYFDGGGVIVQNVPEHGLAWLQVVAWDRRLGNTYESVVALGIGGYGASGLFQASAGCPGCPPPTPPGAVIGLQSFSISAVVPEPGVGVLLLLGLSVLTTRWHLVRRDTQ